MAGAGIAVIGYFIRRHVEESPVFVEAGEVGARTRRPLAELMRSHRSEVVRLILVWLPNTALSYVVSTFALSYIVNELGMSSSLTFGLVLDTVAEQEAEFFSSEARAALADVRHRYVESLEVRLLSGGGLGANGLVER